MITPSPYLAGVPKNAEPLLALNNAFFNYIAQTNMSVADVCHFVLDRFGAQSVDLFFDTVFGAVDVTQESSRMIGALLACPSDYWYNRLLNHEQQ